MSPDSRIITVDQPLYRLIKGRFVKVGDRYMALDDGLALPRILYPIKDKR